MTETEANLKAERDAWRRRVLAARFPGARRYASVEEVPYVPELEPVDLVYADPPSRDPAWLAAV